MDTKISSIILTKDEPSDSLEECIINIQPYANEIIIIDSSTNNSAEIISNKLNCQYYKRKIGDKNIEGFNDLRNLGNAVAKNDWCLHIDVDEIVNESFFKDIDYILKGKIQSIEKAWAYAFPRINLPFYELYPDYQVRFVNKLKTEWINKIHENVDIFTSPVEVSYLDKYPLIHKQKIQNKKVEINNRWKSLNNNRNILICSLFKDSEKYLTSFFQQLKKLIDYTIKDNNHKLELCFIEGNSSDNTYKLLKEWTSELKNINYSINILNLPDSVERFERLAILRNLLIKFGLKNYHDYVLMIDSDTLPKQDLLVKLIESIELNCCDVIAPLPLIEEFRDYKDNYFYDTLAFIDSNGNNFRHFYPYCDEISKKDIIKMNSVGTCYLIKSSIYNINDFNDYNIMKCYKESTYKKPITYEGLDENDVPLSEQVSFFDKAKKAGYQIYLDKNIKIFHINLERLGLSWH